MKRDLRSYCAAYRRPPQHCVATVDEYECAGIECPFYITATARNAKQTEAYKRLLSLPETEQTKIANKYYNGEKPWEGASK